MKNKRHQIDSVQFHLISSPDYLMASLYPSINVINDRKVASSTAGGRSPGLTFMLTFLWVQTPSQPFPEF